MCLPVSMARAVICSLSAFYRMQEKVMMIEPKNPFWKMKRPLRITLLAVYSFFVACWNGLRVGSAIFYWKTLTEYGSYTLYITISGGIWLVTGFLISWGLLARKVWAWFAAAITTVIYGIWYWFDRLVFQKPHANWPFAVGATILLTAIPFSFLLSFRPRQSFLKDSNERKS